MDAFYSDNEFNTRVEFLDIAGAAVRVATFEQYNILIVDDIQNDETEGDLAGRIEPMAALTLQLGTKGRATFVAYVFDSGVYHRKGSLKKDKMWVYPSQPYDPEGVRMAKYSISLLGQ